MKGKFILQATVFVALISIIALFAACGQGSKRVPTISTIGTQQAAELPVMQQQVRWPEGLPEDSVQPWEELDANGYVMPPKAASNLNFATIFASGIERYLEAGDVSDYGEASSFASGAPGGEEVSYAIYRLPMGTDQPGTITADVNLHNGSAYYVGVGDYSVNTWHWYGPYSTTHVRFNVPDAEYTSGLGNLMLAVVAYDGAAFDVVAIGANARDTADTEAPPIPAVPTLTPVAGGVFAEWFEVAAGDLAGYRIYADGTEVLDYIEGGTSLVVPATDEAEVTLTAVDISGNESEMSDPATETPLLGAIPVVELTASAASGVRNDVITLTATGAETYDWDIDGDGVWDFTDDPTDTRDADTSNPGIIRPALRAHTAGGGFSLSALSLRITDNERPEVMATADVSIGPVPLAVNITIIAEDDDGTIVDYAWDFDGDGIFEGQLADRPSPLAHNYTTAGLYNAKFRATDNDRAWDTDTLSIYVLGGEANQPPVAMLSSDFDRVYIGEAGESYSYEDVTFDPSGSWDPEGGPLQCFLDKLGDGHFLPISLIPPPQTYYIPGVYRPTLHVRDEWGASSQTSLNVYAYHFRRYELDTPTTNETGANASLADVNGYLGISYYDPDNQKLKYARALTRYPVCAGDWYYHNLDVAAGYIGMNNDLADLNGKPVISAYNSGTNELCITRATVYLPESILDWVIHAVDTGADVGKGNSIQVVHSGTDARIWIAYYDATNDTVKFARSTNSAPSGSGDWVTQTVDEGGPDISLCAYLVSPPQPPPDDEYYPEIYYYNDFQGGCLKYARATTEFPSSGTDWDYYIMDDGGGVDCVGRMPSGLPRSGGMFLAGNCPSVAYYDETNQELKYAQAQTLSPASASDWDIHVVDDGGLNDDNVGRVASLQYYDGSMWISYHNTSNGRLRLARSKVSSPATEDDWWRHDLDYIGPGDNMWTSLELFAHDSYEVAQPMVAYMGYLGGGGNGLKFAIPTLD